MRALVAFLITILTYVVAQGTGNPTLFHLFYIFAGSLVISYLWAWISSRGVTVHRELYTTRTQVGKVLEEHLVVQNLNVIPKLWIEIRELSNLPSHQAHFALSLPPKISRHLRERTTCQLRGKYTLGPIFVQASDPLSLFRFQISIPSYTDILVYPATEDIHSFYLPPAELPGGTATRRRTHHITSNVSSVRDYTPGDSFNRIHWPSTARQQRLIVKEFELDPTADLWIVMDMYYRMQQSITYRGRPRLSPQEETRTPASTEEYMVTAAASLARYFILRQRRNTGLIAWGQRREVIPPEREPRQFYNILESLAIVRAHGTSPIAEVLAAEANRFGRQTSLVILTPAYDVEWVRTSLRELLYGGMFAVVVLVDSLSFGGWHHLSQVEAELVAHNVPHYILRNEQPIGATLSGVADLVQWRETARFVSERYRGP